MNFRTTVILLVLLVGAIVFLFFANQSGETEKPKPPKPEDEKGRLVLDVKTDDLSKVVIRPGPGAPADAKLIELSKNDKGWNIVQPIDWPADVGESAMLVRLIAEARSTGSVDITDGNRAAIGISKPRYVIEVTDKNGKTSKLTVGERSSLGMLYVSAGDKTDTASIVAGGQLGEKLGQASTKLVTSLRDKLLMRLTSMDVKQVQIDAGTKKLSMARSGGTGSDWKINATPEVPGDSGEIGDILATVTTLRADEFTDDAAAVAGGASFERPRAVITLNTAAPSTQPSQPAAGKPTVITVGQAIDIEGDKCWVKVSNPPSVAKVSLAKTSLDKITGASAVTLRDRKVLELKPDDVSEVTVAIDRPATTQPFIRQAEQKTIKVSRRKADLQLGPAFGPGGAPTTQPSTAPTTQPAAGIPVDSSLAYSPDGLVYVADTADGAATQPTTSPTTAPTTQPTAPATQSPVIPPAPVEPEKPKSKWVLDEKGAAADDGQVDALLGDLNPLRAMKYLEKAPPATQPAAVTYVVTIKTVAAGGAQSGSYELRITDPGGVGQPTATYNGLTFEIDRSFVRKLEGDFKTPRADNSPMTPPGMPGGGFPGMPGLPPGHP